MTDEKIKRFDKDVEIFLAKYVTDTISLTYAWYAVMTSHNSHIKIMN